MSIPVTAHFSVAEFASHDGESYPAEWIQPRLVPLCNVLESARTACGSHPMTILSGYRSPAHNAAVGGAKASQHMEGRAADITVQGVTPVEVHAMILQLYRQGAIKIGGLGLYDGWVHVDIRDQDPTGHLAQWTGTKIGDEVA